jgi:hypothetical protein
METFSTRWQVEHSKVRSSKPRFPGEIPANPILCLQVGHIGRSRMENLRISVHKRIDIHISKGRSVRCPTHGVNNGPPAPLRRRCAGAKGATDNCRWRGL